MGVPQNGWFMRDNPFKLDDLGVPPFVETSICVEENVLVLSGNKRFPVFQIFKIKSTFVYQL